MFEALDRITFYVSSKDLAIRASEWIVGSDRRLGQLRMTDLQRHPDITMGPVKNIHVIDAKVKTDLLGHYYFYENPAVSSDLVLLLRDDCDPGIENGRPLTNLGPSFFWQITDDYPNAREKPTLEQEKENN